MAACQPRNQPPRRTRRSRAHTFRISQIPIAECAAFSAPHPPRVLSLAAFGRRPLVYVAPLSLAGIRNPSQIDPSRCATLGPLRRYRESWVNEIRYLTPVERWMSVEDLQTPHQQDRQKQDIDPVRRADQRRVPIDQPAAGPIASPLIWRRRRVPNLVQLLRRPAHRSLLAGQPSRSRRHIGGFTPSAPITTAAASEPSFFITTKTLRPAAS